MKFTCKGCGCVIYVPSAMLVDTRELIYVRLQHAVDCPNINIQPRLRVHGTFVLFSTVAEIANHICDRYGIPQQEGA